MKIKIDTEELVKKQVISQEVADGIAQYYNSSKNTENSKYALSFIAAIFVLTGITILIADFWNETGTNAHIFFCLLPIIIGSAASYFVASKFMDKRIITEGVAILQCVAIYMTFVMINSTFKINLSNTICVILPIILSFPFVIYFRAAIAATSLILIGAFTLFDDSSRSYANINTTLVCLVFILDVLFLYINYFKAKDTLLLNFRLFIAPFVLLAFYYHFVKGLCDSDRIVLFLLPLVFTCCSFTFAAWNKVKRWLETDTKWLELGAFLLSFSFLTLALSGKPFSNGKIEVLEILPFVFALLASWMLQWKNSIKIEPAQYICLIATVVTAAACPFLERETRIIVAPILFVYLAYHTYQWTKNFNIIFFNATMLCWIIAIFNIADVNDFNPSIVAGIIIAWGVALLAANYYLIKKKKDHGLQENR